MASNLNQSSESFKETNKYIFVVLVSDEKQLALLSKSVIWLNGRKSINQTCVNKYLPFADVNDWLSEKYQEEQTET